MLSVWQSLPVNRPAKRELHSLKTIMWTPYWFCPIFSARARLLVNPNLGPRIRLATVLTLAELEQDEEYHKNLCEGCKKFCASACPVNAITDNGVDLNKCVKENVKHGLPGLIGLRKKISDTNDINNYLKNYLLEPTFWRIWQATTSGVFYDCFECMKACPIGE